MKNSKRLICLTVALVMLTVTVFTGCGRQSATTEGTTSQPTTASASGTTQAEKTTESLKEVTLTWYQPVFSGVPADLQLVNDEVNKQTLEKINAKVNMNFIPFGEYENKMSMVLASGEAADICFTANWANNFSQNVAKGAFLPLDDLLSKYAPKTKASISDNIWQAVKVSGKIYAVVNQQILAWADGWVLRKDMVDKYNFDITSIKKYEDIEPFLKAVKDGEKDVIPLEARYLMQNNQMAGYECLLGQYLPGAVNLSGGELKVVNQWETPEYKEWFKINREWYLKGYIQKDAGNLKDVSAYEKAGKYAAIPNGVIIPGGEADLKASKGGFDYVMTSYTDRLLMNSSVMGTLMAIIKSSENPERAMMFLEMLNSDQKFFNLIAHGVENTHYKKISDNQIEAIKDSKYDPNQSWSFGNSFLSYYLPGQKVGLWDDQISLNNNAKPAPTLGFPANTEPIKSEIAQCQAVGDQYLMGLWTGSIDTEKYLPEFLDKLKKAGSDKIVAEMQKQLDAWSKTK